jgi:hypothetical protein
MTVTKDQWVKAWRMARQPDSYLADNDTMLPCGAWTLATANRALETRYETERRDWLGLYGIRWQLHDCLSVAMFPSVIKAARYRCVEPEKVSYFLAESSIDKRINRKGRLKNGTRR